MVIRFAPIGIFGLVTNTIATTGFSALAEYSHLVAILLSAMLIIALLVNPLIVFLIMKKNPYPLVFTCLRESGITAFFTRSSAANIPVNIALCKKLNLHEDVVMQIVAIGFIIGVIQDSAETALNSSTDVVFSAAASHHLSK